MKKTFIISLFAAASLSIYSQQLIEEMSPSDFRKGSSISLFASKELISYSITALYSISESEKGLKAAFTADIYDNIEYTEIPDPSLPISPSNIPYVSSVEALTSYSLYTVYWMNSGRIAWSIGQRSTIFPIVGEYALFTGLLAGVSYTAEGISMSLDLEDVASTSYYSKNIEIMNAPERARFASLFDVLSSESFSLKAGAAFMMTYGERTDLRFTSGRFSFDRSLIVEYVKKNLSASADIFGPEISAGISYKISDRLQIRLRFARKSGMNMAMTGIRAEI